MTYQEYEKKCQEIIAKNAVFLNEFREDLEEAGLKDQTVRRHCNNVDFYINTYLIREQPLEMLEGTSSYRIDDFLGFFFIRKCMWSRPSSIKSSAASIKKFYQSMMKRGRIQRDNYEEITSAIKEMREEWMEICKDYKDPTVKDPFSFF